MEPRALWLSLLVDRDAEVSCRTFKGGHNRVLGRLGHLAVMSERAESVLLDFLSADGGELTGGERRGKLCVTLGRFSLSANFSFQ